MAGRLLADDPEMAYEHAMVARRKAARVAAVREAAGVAAYAAARYDEALSELRAHRRMTGDVRHLPLLADCERGLGRPERALELARSADAELLDGAGRVELRIVGAGARRDLGQTEAAIVALQGPDLRRAEAAEWGARLLYAYADALLAAGREDEARSWFVRAANADETGETDAAERLAELEGVSFLQGPDETAEPDEPDHRPGRERQPEE